MLEREHGQRRLGGDVRVAVAVAADPGAEAQRARVQRQLDADPTELLGERLEHVRHRVAVQRVEVVDGAARLVDDLRAGAAQLVRLPQQRDLLLQPAPDAPLGRRVAGLPQGALPGFQQARDPAQLAQHGAPRRLGRVGGEHGPQPEVADVLGDLRRRVAGRRHAVDGLREPRAALAPDRRQLARAMDLLGDIGEVEVEREGAHDRRRRAGVQAGQQVGGRRAVAGDRDAQAFEAVEHLGPFLGGQGAAEQLPELAQVALEAVLAREGGGRGRQRG